MGPTRSLNNFTLKYVDASFYQVARGLVLPFTVVLSSIMLHHRPSLLIMVAICIVTGGFLLGVAMDLAPGGMTTTTPIGVICGVLSSVTTALQAVVIKQALGVVGGNAMDLSWYNNVLCAFIMVPCIVLAGEVPNVMRLFSEGGPALSTFIYGSAITVRPDPIQSPLLHLMTYCHLPRASSVSSSALQASSASRSPPQSRTWFPLPSVV